MLKGIKSGQSEFISQRFICLSLLLGYFSLRFMTVIWEQRHLLLLAVLLCSWILFLYVGIDVSDFLTLRYFCVYFGGHRYTRYTHLIFSNRKFGTFEVMILMKVDWTSWGANLFLRAFLPQALNHFCWTWHWLYETNSAVTSFFDPCT